MLVNTQEFRRSGQYFLKNGVYTRAPKGTRDYKEFWKQELQRCKFGYQVGDLFITGRNYFYLNYCVIERIPEHIAQDKEYVGQVEKELAFPGFWQIDYEWWNAKDKAANRKLGTGNHLVCLKTRGCGFSFKEAADGVYNYVFIPKSKSFYLASNKEYLVGDAILDKVNTMLGHLKIHSPFGKTEQRKHSIMHRKASYFDDADKGVEKGFLSEIMGVIVPSHNPDKVRGKRGIKITFEEAGSFGNIKSAWMIAKEGVEQGGYLAGQMSAFGTGGEEGEDIEGLEEMFKDPLSFNCMAFDNKWAEVDLGLQNGDAFHIPSQFTSGAINEPPREFDDSVCGFFVPNVAANDKFMDLDGNIDMEASFEFELKSRRALAKAKDPKVRDEKIAERPFVPDEALYRMHDSALPAFEAREQLKRIEGSPYIKGMIRHGILSYVEGKGLQFRPADVTPLDKYPHSNSDNLKGCVSMVETPHTVQDSSGKRVVPDGLYQIVVDPYKKDNAEDKTSLGAAYVIKLDAGYTSHVCDIPIAWYVARPNRLKEFLDNLFKLAEYYNAKIQGENDGGGEAVVAYARHNKLLHKLEFEPDMLHNKELASNSKNRSFLMNMTTARKEIGLLYFADYLTERIGTDDFGHPILRMHKIYDVGLLQEISKYREDRNADRVSAMIIAMYVIRETTEIRKQKLKKPKSNFWSRPLFTDTQERRKTIRDGVIWLE